MFEKRKLGRTGIDVTSICLGTMTWGQQNTEAEGHAQLDLAIGRGINFIDTAEMYSIPPKAETQGSTERIIGSWLKARGGRERIVLATKVSGRSSNDWLRPAANLPGSTKSISATPSKRRCGACRPTMSTSTNSTGPTGW